MKNFKVLFEQNYKYNAHLYSYYLLNFSFSTFSRLRMFQIIIFGIGIILRWEVNNNGERK